MSLLGVLGLLRLLTHNQLLHEFWDSNSDSYNCTARVCTSALIYLHDEHHLPSAWTRDQGLFAKEIWSRGAGRGLAACQFLYTVLHAIMWVYPEHSDQAGHGEVYL